MKKNVATILAAVSCLLVVLCLYQISNLNRQIHALESNLSNQIGNVRNNVNGIASRISASLAEQASLLADSAWEYGEVDYDARAVALTCAVSPKEYAPDTQAVMVVGGTEHPMTLSGGAFTATIDIPLFGQTQDMKVLFREGDVTRTQLLDWHLSPRYDYLLNVYAHLDGSATGSPKDGVYHYRRDGVINIDADTKQPNGVKAIALVEVMDGKEVGRTSIPLDNTAFFENEQNESGRRVERAKPVTQVAGGKVLGPFYYALEKDCEIPYGSTWLLYIEVADSNGLLYRSVVDRQEVSDSGAPIDDGHWWVGTEADIYDAQGNALYEPAEALYQ